jgi:hypothetical protein
VIRCASVLALAGALIIPVAAIAATPANISAVATQTSSHQAGKLLTFTETLRTAGKVIGHDKVACTTISKSAIACHGVFTFATGKVSVKGVVSFAKKTNTLPITSGSGAYASVKGSLTLKNLTQTTTTQVFKFK